jgi:hypothetical protein
LVKEFLELESKGGRDPDIVVKNPSESKGGVAQKYIKVRTENINRRRQSKKYLL